MQDCIEGRFPASWIPGRRRPHQHHEPRPAAPPGGTMPTVLIVDDEQHIRLLFEQTLEELEDDGVELLTAGDGDEALTVIESHRPALVFLAVLMPKRNGFDVWRV